MRFSSKSLIGLLILCVAMCCMAQSVTGTAPSIAAGTINVEGQLTEGCWTSATNKVAMKGDDATFVMNSRPDFDNAGDCTLEFVLLWDTDALYMGSWWTDDINQAPHSQSIITAMQTHEDDCIEYNITVNWENAYADPSGPYMGDFGWHIQRGMSQTDAAGSIGHEIGGAFSGNALTPADFTTYGFEEYHSSNDGINYQSEMKTTWAGQVMSNKGAAFEGENLGIGILAFDNDDGSSAEGVMSWCGQHSPWMSPDGWAKVTLGPAMGIEPRVKVVQTRTVKPMGVYDIQGRLLGNSRAPIVSPLRFTMDRRTNTKSLVLK